MFAEDVYIPERLVVAPLPGICHPTVIEINPPEPLPVAIGDEIGVIIRTGEKHPIECAFTGILAGWLVLPGERVRAAQPVAWLILDDR